jgi:hypothetical protein
VAPDAIVFYEGCGFTVATADRFEPSRRESVFMTKRIVLD